MFIRFLRDYQNGAGRMYQGGEVIDADKRWADQLIAEGAAVENRSGDASVVTLNADPLTGGVALVGADYIVPIFTSGLVKRMAGSIVAEATPNLTLLDTGASAGTANTQIGMLTIPGGVMGPTSRLLIHSIISATGGNGKTIFVRAGPASGTYATATGFAGQSGLTNQVTMAQTPMIWNQGTLASQLATPANVVSYSNTGNSTTPVVALSIDTSLDWNIYFGVQMNVLNGGDSMTLRHCYAQILN